MEHRKDIHECFSEAAINLLFKEAREGKLKANEIRRLALQFGGGGYREFNKRENTEDLDDVLGFVFDAWYKENGNKLGSKTDGDIFLVDVLENIHRRDLASKIRKQSSVSMQELASLSSQVFPKNILSIGESKEQYSDQYLSKIPTKQTDQYSKVTFLMLLLLLVLAVLLFGRCYLQH